MKTKILAIALAAAAASIAADETIGFSARDEHSIQRSRKTYRFVFSHAARSDNPAAVAAPYSWNASAVVSDRHGTDW